jgi:DnaJ-class molecular chaperone
MSEITQIGNIIPNFMQKYFSKVTRLETITNIKCGSCHGAGVIGIAGQPGSLECPDCHGLGIGGRDVLMWDSSKQIRLELQDKGRTLKIFITERVEEDE